MLLVIIYFQISYIARTADEVINAQSSKYCPVALNKVGNELYPFVWSSIYSIFNNNILCRKGQEEEN